MREANPIMTTRGHQLRMNWINFLNALPKTPERDKLIKEIERSARYSDLRGELHQAVHLAVDSGFSKVSQQYLAYLVRKDGVITPTKGFSGCIVWEGVNYIVYDVRDLLWQGQFNAGMLQHWAITSYIGDPPLDIPCYTDIFQIEGLR